MGFEKLKASHEKKMQERLKHRDEFNVAFVNDGILIVKHGQQMFLTESEIIELLVKVIQND